MDGNLCWESIDVDLELNGYKLYIDQIEMHVDVLEKKIREMERYYASSGQKAANGSSKSANRYMIGSRKQAVTAPTSRRMQDLMSQFDGILRHIAQNKWAGPFLEPVDVEGLGLEDYYEVIDRPMDLSTVRKKMEECRYRNVREVQSDVRLIFKNAMKYNDEKHEVHVMARTLLSKFDEKWLQLLPKVVEEERRCKAEDSRAMVEVHRTRDAAYARAARDLYTQLGAVDDHLESLRNTITTRCKKMTPADKIRIGTSLVHLSVDDLTKALEIVSEDTLDLPTESRSVDIDIDAQSERTLWRLKFLVKKALEAQGRPFPPAHHPTRKRVLDSVLLNAAAAAANNNANKRVKKV